MNESSDTRKPAIVFCLAILDKTTNYYIIEKNLWQLSLTFSHTLSFCSSFSSKRYPTNKRTEQTYMNDKINKYHVLQLPKILEYFEF